MELRHLRYFVAAAEELHFTRAARRLGIAQPPLTQQIKALETEIGVRLFDRSARGVALTDAGTAFLEDARTILAEVNQAVMRSRQAASGLIGRLGIGFTESASFHNIVTASLRSYRQGYGAVELFLEEARSTDLTLALRQGKIDVAFVRPPIRLEDDIVLEVLVTEPMVVAVPIGHALSRRRTLRLTDLRDEKFILYPRRTSAGLTDRVIAACEAAGFTPMIAQSAPQIASSINLVAASLGVSIVPACMHRSRPEAVRYIDIEDRPPQAQLGLAYRAAERSAVALRFIEIARAEAAQASSRAAKS